MAEAGDLEAKWSAELDKFERLYKPGWLFVRLCKAHPDLAGLAPIRAARRVLEALKLAAGVDRACPKVYTMAGDWATSHNEFYARFTDCWMAIRFLPGEGPLDSAARRALQDPLPLANGADAIPGYVRVVSCAAYLQAARGDQAIYLPCRDLGTRLGLDRTTVSRFLRLAEGEGVVERVARHRPGSGLADEFRVDLSLWPDRFPAQAS